VQLLLGVLGLYIRDRELAAALEKRRQALYVEMAFTLGRADRALATKDSRGQ